MVGFIPVLEKRSFSVVVRDAERLVITRDVRLSNDSESFALAMPLKGEAFASNFP
ncbi:hypothetical protein HTIA_2453 [Halorhabdus tiamatea SARL4B]|uniref:Uncharacterized protein n=1 Tax=Halorhabdus tiamatea SARL4B TaxID=1033806 RepID=F7PLZ8_9EURY|nr:hypothetical protein HTIA_2453 [Halorhabdus tiamatea SARL4B]